MTRKFTPGPWVVFSVEGKPRAILPAGRPGSIAEFSSLPTVEDALLMAEAPRLASFLTSADEDIDRLFKAVERAIEGFEAVRASNLERGHAACDEIIPELRRILRVVNGEEDRLPSEEKDS